MEIRTRIAPSPTGNLHIGTARTALFNYAFAKQKSGKFILRIEDTDLERSDKKFEEDIIENLKWLGLHWNEFYRQSERTESHAKYLQKLLDEQKAFYCSHSEKELLCSDRGKGLKEGIIRLKNDKKGEIAFKDIIRGEISFDAQALGDFSLAKNLDTPLYNFAVVVDDKDMNISHVIRGEDHISNTPKQRLVQEALGFETPLYAHLPLILDEKRAKLSKRAGAESIREYKEMGYLPEALINFLILLGWHPEDDREIFSLEEIIPLFSLKRVQKGGAIFDALKLNWINREHAKMKGTEELVSLLKNFIPEKWLTSGLNLSKIAPLAIDRISRLSDAAEEISFFFELPNYPREMLYWKGRGEKEAILKRLGKLGKIISEIPGNKFSVKSLEAAVMPYAEEEGRGEVLWPFRVALSGREKSPGPFEIAEILGREKVCERIQHAKEILK